jgi:Protein of unknown function (DUF3891)
VIIRRSASSQQLITQPEHAALAERIMRQWDDDHFPESSRKASILRAIEQHDCGWAEIDEALAVNETTGQLLDFLEVSDAVKRDTSSRGIEQLSSDPYAAALVTQHRLHVYRRYAEHPEWKAFMADLTAARDAYLHAAGHTSLDLVSDYAFVRAGDLASLAFCNEWADVDPDGCGYAMRLQGMSLFFSPDPFGGRTIEIAIDAKEIANQLFSSAADARRAAASAKVVTLTGRAIGGAAAPIV